MAGQMDAEFRPTLDRMKALCAKREYCEADIRKKLSGSPAADEIVDILKKEKFIDDSRYARAFVRDKSAISGWGRVKIRQALRSKGIENDAVNGAMAEMDGNPGLAKLSRALETKARSLADAPDCRYRLLRFALGRGFEYDEVRELVDAAVAGLNDKGKD